MYEQFPNSNEAKALKRKRQVKDKEVPFEELQPGMSYALPLADYNVLSLSVLCSRYSRQYKKKFKMVIHAEHKMIEIARVDNGTVEAVDIIEHLEDE